MSFIGLVGTFAWAGSAREDTVDRLQKSVDVLHAIMSTPDKGIPEEVLSNAKCILVVPDLIKGGFILGGKHGRGVASCRTTEGWSAPAFVSVGGGSWGLQIGVEGVNLVMLVMNEQGLQHLLSSKFARSGEGSVAAGPVGRHASARADWNRVSIPFSTAEFWMTDLVPIPALRSCALSVGGEAIRDRVVASRKLQPHCSPARQSRVPRQRKREVLPTRPPA